MRIVNLQVVDTDVLVIGGGGAALRAALAAHDAGAAVRVVVKTALRGGGSTATGASEIMGFAAALGEADRHDSPDWHFRDTMAGALGLVDPDLVRILANEAPERLHELDSWGVRFERNREGKLVQTMSDFATYPRVCRVVGGRTGPAIVDCLMEELRRRAIPVDENVSAVRLMSVRGRIAAVLAVRTQDGIPVAYRCKATVLAAGGMGGAFRHSVGGPTMTGDAYAMAYAAGAELVNMDVTQVAPGMIHPHWAFLSRPVYVVGPRLLNGEGEEFLHRYLPPHLTIADVFAHKAAPYTTSNASRYVDEAIEAEARAGRVSSHGGVYYDLTHVPEPLLQQKLPNTLAHLRTLGVDLCRDRMEVAILFHLVNGGVRMVDGTCASTVPGLFVVGEAAGGVRGPNRPGGNSLAEGQVFGCRAGLYAAQAALTTGAPEPAVGDLASAWRELTTGRPSTMAELSDLRRHLETVMTDACLVAKDANRLKRALAELDALAIEANRTTAADPADVVYALGTSNAVTAAILLARSVLTREETRGAHNRTDFPNQDDERWRCSVVVRQGAAGPLVGTFPYLASHSSEPSGKRSSL